MIELDKLKENLDDLEFQKSFGSFDGEKRI